MNFAHLSGINAILTIFNIHHYSHSMELVKWDSLKIQASSSTASYEHEIFLGVEIFLKYTPEQTISP